MAASKRLCKSKRPAAAGGGMLLLVLLLAQCAGAARVLVHPFPWASRAFDLVALSSELARRGHDVLLVMPLELSGRIGDMLKRETVSDGGGAGSVALLEYDSIPMEKLRVLEGVGLFKLIRGLEQFLFDSCAIIFGNQTAVDALYDFAADIFVGDSLTSGSWIMSDILGLPRIDYNSGAGGAAVEATVYALSVPSLAYTPMYSSALPPTGMTLPQRTANALTMGCLRLINYFLPYSTSSDMRRRVNTTWRNSAMPEPNRHAAILTLSGVDVGIELPRPLPPHVKYVGPLLAAPPRPLPPDLDDFVSGAGDSGVILAAFGSLLNVQPYSLVALAKAFAALPQRVVWKVKAGDLSADTRQEFDAAVAAAGNMMVLPWLPQQDLLGHPVVKVFLSHGGIHSVYEALWHATPMVLMPLATDQFDNARLVADYHRAGRIVDRATLAKGDTAQLVTALQQVIHQPGYRQRAQALSKRLQAQPGTPCSRAAEWVEYALATGPQPFLWPQEIGMHWWQLAFLDAAAIAAAMSAAGLAAAAWCLRRCTRRRKDTPSAQAKHAKRA